ncbi:uncharacterized protein [Miscanthus floridulus]|uniref:uncharacterized protein n=1 Tax=Miscanthus floridulus TaxID=154761 RepID=UPI0034580F2B
MINTIIKIFIKEFIENGSNLRSKDANFIISGIPLPPVSKAIRADTDDTHLRVTCSWRKKYRIIQITVSCPMSAWTEGRTSSTNRAVGEHKQYTLQDISSLVSAATTAAAIQKRPADQAYKTYLIPLILQLFSAYILNPKS